MEYGTIPGQALAYRFVPQTPVDHEVLKYLFRMAVQGEAGTAHIIDGGDEFDVNGYTTLVANKVIDGRVERIEIKVCLGDFDDYEGRHWCAFAQDDPTNDGWNGLGTVLEHDGRIKAFLLRQRGTN